MGGGNRGRRSDAENKEENTGHILAILAENTIYLVQHLLSGYYNISHAPFTITCDNFEYIKKHMSGAILHIFDDE